MPIYGLLIRLCTAIGFLQPIVWLTLYFCEDYPTKGTDKKIKVLALCPPRFRGDLDVLSQSGGFEVKALPHFWMCRILYTFYKSKPTFEAFYPERDKHEEDHERLAKFMSDFLPMLYKKTGTDIVISAAVHYISDHLWGMHSSLNGTSFIVMHRESFMASEHIRKIKRDFWRRIGSDFVIDRLISQTSAANDVFIESDIITQDKGGYAGTLRMDDFVGKYYNENTPLPEEKCVTLFSFTYAFGVWSPVPHWYDNHEDYDGFSHMFDEVHAAFAQFAKKHPDVKCVIKPKWDKNWIEKIDLALERFDMNRSDIPNLEILPDVNVWQLIAESNVICGYGSTTILESIVIGGRPIVVPQLGEIQRPENQNKIMMSEGLPLFDTAYSMDEFVEKIEHRLFEDPFVPKDIQEKREKLFETWSSFLDQSALEKYTALFKETIEHKKKEET